MYQLAGEVGDIFAAAAAQNTLYSSICEGSIDREGFSWLRGKEFCTHTHSHSKYIVLSLV